MWIVKILLFVFHATRVRPLLLLLCFKSLKRSTGGAMRAVLGAQVSQKWRETHFFALDARESLMPWNLSNVFMVVVIHFSMYDHTCINWVIHYFFRLKVHYLVNDDTGSCSVVFWDKLATELLHQSAAELKQMLIAVMKIIHFYSLYTLSVEMNELICFSLLRRNVNMISRPNVMPLLEKGPYCSLREMTIIIVTLHQALACKNLLSVGISLEVV